MTQMSSMTRRDILVDQFVRVVSDEHKALLYVQTARGNHLVLKMMAIVKELKLMAGDQRRALLPLLKSENIWIRYRAAQAVLALEPHPARLAIETVRDAGIQPEAASAASTLGLLDDGTIILM